MVELLGLSRAGSSLDSESRATGHHFFNQTTIHPAVLHLVPGLQAPADGLGRIGVAWVVGRVVPVADPGQLAPLGHRAAASRSGRRSASRSRNRAPTAASRSCRPGRSASYRALLPRRCMCGMKASTSGIRRGTCRSTGPCSRRSRGGMRKQHVGQDVHLDARCGRLLGEDDARPTSGRSARCRWACSASRRAAASRRGSSWPCRADRSPACRPAPSRPSVRRRAVGVVGIAPARRQDVDEDVMDDARGCRAGTRPPAPRRLP